MLKRSQVNRAIETFKQVLGKLNIKLPPFAHWTAEDWKTKGKEADEIRHCMLGWDVTDFGQNRFEQIGRILFTLRNGTSRHQGYKKIYAEKLILDPPHQKPPQHFHKGKMEDIINRGGGSISIQLHASTEDGRCSDEDLTVQVDGLSTCIKAGGIVRLRPGQSICIPPRTIHQFWGEPGTGGVNINGVEYTVSGEVSSVCDDWNDNFWLEPCERFCKIEEDEPRQHYLVHEYPSAT